MVALKGIGKTTAEKVIEARELSPFLNMADLKERVDLPFRGDWENYNIDFSVEEK